MGGLSKETKVGEISMATHLGLLSEEHPAIEKSGWELPWLSSG